MAGVAVKQVAFYWRIPQTKKSQDLARNVPPLLEGSELQTEFSLELLLIRLDDPWTPDMFNYFGKEPPRKAQTL